MSYYGDESIGGSILEGNVDGPGNTPNQCWDYDSLYSNGSTTWLVPMST